MRRVALLAGALVVVVAAVVLLWPSESEREPVTGAVAPEPTRALSTATPTMEAPASEVPTSESPASPTPEPEGHDVTRLLVPALGIDAPIVVLGVDPDGTMQSPDNPHDVAWYSFSARPGERSNVVMAGHLDYVNHGPAVFYRLRDAKPGDEIQMVLVDGSTARYRVLDVTTYDEATAPVQEIVGPTDTEIVTLITCGGSFDPSSREYDKRVVLRGERIDSAASGGS